MQTRSAASAFGQTSYTDTGLPDDVTISYRYNVLGTAQAGAYTLVPFTAALLTPL